MQTMLMTVASGIGVSLTTTCVGSSILIAFGHGRSASARRCLLGPFVRL
jgi:hypothetical protein